MKTILILLLLFVSNAFSQVSQLNVLQSNNPSPGKLFYANLTQGGSANIAFLTIFNNNGSVFFSRQTPFRTTDFKRQNNGLYSYYSGTSELELIRNHYIMDSNLNVIDSFNIVSPLPTDTFYTDSHDFQMLSNGHVVFVGVDFRRVDMSVIVPGGNTNAKILGHIIQEQDENKNVVWEWDYFDHFLIQDAIGVNLTAASIDPWHWNAIERDYDGNYLVSNRHLSEITKISRTTGNIIWRLGGKRNQFIFINDPVTGDTMQHFSYQHDIRRLPNGNIMLFDNGNFHSPPESRAVEYTLNEVTKTCTRVWQYKNVPALYGFATGGCQRLPNGNTLISWGTTGRITEVTPAGTIALELQNNAVGVFSYRVYKYDVDSPLLLKLTVIPQGYFTKPTIVNDELNMRDTVRTYLRSRITPYALIDSAKAIIDTVSAIGNFTFNTAQSGIYYIVVKHRNCIETWSKLGGQLLVDNTTNQYSFISGASQAYGNNQKLISGVWCIYSGDCNQDGSVDGSDLSSIDNDVYEFITGYVPSDVTGDGIVDGSDVIITENNSRNSVQMIRP